MKAPALYPNNVEKTKPRCPGWAPQLCNIMAFQDDDKEKIKKLERQQKKDLSSLWFLSFTQVYRRLKDRKRLALLPGPSALAPPKSSLWPPIQSNIIITHIDSPFINRYRWTFLACLDY
jgi:hypothetical protein